MLALAAVVVVAAAVAFWAVVVTEGAYLGRRVVVWLYDRSAHEYDELKGFAVDDADRLVAPLLKEAAHRPSNGVRSGPAQVLDVATGTGRLPVELLAEPRFEGDVVGLDLAPRMLEHAWRKVGGWWPRAQLVLADADRLPFVEGAFDAVACLEALEFTAQPARTLNELVRVLRPGGLLMVTNRVGWEARLMPGRAFGAHAFEARLTDMGLTAVRTERWQAYYDLVFATAPGRPQGPPPPWPTCIRCPRCRRALTGPPRAPVCGGCGFAPHWRAGAWDLVLRGAGGPS